MCAPYSLPSVPRLHLELAVQLHQGRAGHVDATGEKTKRKKHEIKMREMSCLNVPFYSKLVFGNNKRLESGGGGSS